MAETVITKEFVGLTLFQKIVTVKESLWVNLYGQT